MVHKCRMLSREPWGVSPLKGLGIFKVALTRRFRAGLKQLCLRLRRDSIGGTE
jgi:hypothetical protein